ncbi:TetR/AcrR family transcriptional regulator [Mesorhizobium sp. DCY119]|uniref:TetR/AcrR family transcriptional regulator n=1 Tax=Mesorhizobium sp. DCY119 TaxID=2108445 RepID=UPI000E6CF3F0|nr:TetR/AcrR family transcriptional regulator [Mesorhizobium sp. DCY119]RJG46295.1 TetR/AcrR family transcriptional regulator [Mesorhizobium sp. DCY119]
MRVTKEKAQENRDRIVDTAAVLFREHGFDSVGVAQLMEQAGFTHGGFYNHFRSKEGLVVEAAAKAFGETAARYSGRDAVVAIELYISREHRDARGHGCPAAALSGEAARQPDETKSVFAVGIENLVRVLEDDIARRKAHASEARMQAINVFAQAVGAIVLSRACPDNSMLADEILDACRADCLSTIQHGARK